MIRPFLSRYGLALSGALIAGLTWVLLTPQPPKAPQAIGFAHLDKLVHFSLFFLACIPALWGRPERWRWFVPVMVLFGAVVELIQPLFGRLADGWDFIANTLGVLAAFGLTRIVSECRHASQHKRPQRHG